jgi:GT2 family glycosyltransferase
MEISIVVVTWNCVGYLPAFFGSLAGFMNAPSTEVIVVDNASTDGTSAFIKASFPSVRLIENPHNEGFAKANNIGLARARGELIALVNPDVKLLPGCFERMVELMRQRTDVGLLGPQMLGADGMVHRSTMRFPNLYNVFWGALALDALFPRARMFHSYLTREFDHDETREVEVLNGWFWMTRRRAFEQVGGLDETFFMYGEDIDWSLRFHNAGWKLMFLASATAVHFGGGSSSNAPVRFFIEQQRALLLYFKKHHSRVQYAGVVGSSCLHHLVRIAGHSVGYGFRHSQRESARFKIRRSAACIRWLLAGSAVPPSETS